MGGVDITKVRKAVGESTKPVAQEQKPAGFLNREIRFFKPRLPDRVKEGFYLELSTLLSSGVDIRSALELLAEEQTKPRHRELVTSIHDKIVEGAPLSDALKTSAYFTPYEYFSVQIGEESGKLNDVLKELALFYTKKLKQRRQMINALSYPSLILFTSVAAVIFMLTFIVPMFSDVFARFGGELPALTKSIISLSEFFASQLPVMLLLTVALTVFVFYNKGKTWFRRYGTTIFLKIPVVGEVYSSIHLARFCSAMALLIGSKVPLLNAIQLVRQMMNFYPIDNSLAHIEKAILNGDSLHSALKKFKIYSPRMVALLKVGEEVNSLDKFFDKLGKNYAEEAEHKTGLLSTFLEPVMIIFLGVIVGFILIAMYLPMFQLSSSIGG